MIRVTIVQADGVERNFEDIEPGQSLMEVGRNNAVKGILADCGGGCACATCHVYVDPQWQGIVGPPDDIEADILDMAEGMKENSRLSCQIKLRPELDGLRVTVAPNDAK